MKIRYVVQYDSDWGPEWFDDRSFVDKADAEWYLSYRRIVKPKGPTRSWRLIQRTEESLVWSK